MNPAINRDLRYRKTEKNIRWAFKKLMCEKSFEKITIKEICEYAEINRKTFYAHYLDTRQLLASLSFDTAEGLYKILIDYRFDGKIFGDNGIPFTGLQFDGVPALFQYTTFTEGETVTFPLPENFEHYMRQFNLVLNKIFSERAETDYRDNLKIIEYTTEFIASGLIGFYNTWYQSGRSVEALKVLDAMSLQMVHYIWSVCVESKEYRNI